MRKEVLVIFPNKSAYELKTWNERFYTGSLFQQQINKFIKAGIKPVFIAEDELAVYYNSEKSDGEWVTCLSPSDRKFMIMHIEGFKNAYQRLNPKPINVRAIQEASKVSKPITRESCLDDLEFYTKRARGMMSKVKHTISKSIPSVFQIVLYFDCNNNYCRCVDTKEGDGLFVCKVDMSKELTDCYYSGFQVSEEMFIKLLEGTANL